MIYLLLLVSLTANGVLVWYIRTLIKKYLFDVETVDKFTEMLEQYATALNSLYKVEELYGDENIKKAINQTNFVIEACREFRGSFVESENTTREDSEETTSQEDRVIRLRDGEKITQDASSYKRVVIEN